MAGHPTPGSDVGKALHAAVATCVQPVAGPMGDALGKIASNLAGKLDRSDKKDSPALEAAGADDEASG